MTPRPLTRLRKICLTLPEAHEKEAWGEPTFRVRDKIFAMHASASNHHGRGRPGVWCKAAPSNQEFMVRHAPTRFFVPPYAARAAGSACISTVTWTGASSPSCSVTPTASPRPNVSSRNSPRADRNVRRTALALVLREDAFVPAHFAALAIELRDVSRRETEPLEIRFVAAHGYQRRAQALARERPRWARTSSREHG